MRFNAVYAVIGVVSVSGVAGAILSPANAIQILGFCAVIAAQLVNSLKLGEIASVTNKTHDLANSKQGIELQIAATAATTLAKLDPTAELKRAAELARDKVKEHELIQANVDGKKMG